MQVTAQKNQWELDKLVTQTDVTKKMSIEEIDVACKDGAYIIGYVLVWKVCGGWGGEGVLRLGKRERALV
jgi:hypothetical protein